MQLLELTHANLKTPIFVAKSLVFAVYFSLAHKCTHILSAGGAIIPVVESVEEVNQKLKETV